MSVEWKPLTWHSISCVCDACLIMDMRLPLLTRLGFIAPVRVGGQ